MVLLFSSACVNFSNIVSAKIDNPELITESSYPEYINIVRKEPDTEKETAGSTKHYQSTTGPLYMKFVTAFVYKKIEK